MPVELRGGGASVKEGFVCRGLSLDFSGSRQPGVTRAVAFFFSHGTLTTALTKKA
jgi:hypothetical protein